MLDSCTIRKINPRFGVIFDFDGTLLDNVHIHLDSWRQAITSHGGVIDDQHYKRIVLCNTGIGVIRTYFPDIDSDPQKLASIREERRRIYVDMMKPAINECLVAGIRSFLGILKNNGIPFALATTTRRDEVSNVIGRNGILKDFTALVTYEDVENLKPHPDPYLLAARLLGVEPSSCVGFEDSYIGIKAVNHAAGMKCVVVGTSLTAAEVNESKLSCDMFIKDYRTLTLEQLSLLFNIGS